MTTMPRQTSRLHIKPYWIGDSPHAVHVCARQRPGGDGDQFIDLNVQAALDGDVVCHWGTAAENGYRYIVRRGGIGRRAMTREELHRPIAHWKVADIKRWRRTKRRGRSYASKVRIMEVGEMTRLCKRVGVVPTYEMKSRLFRLPSIAGRLVRTVQAVGTRAYFMALVNMAYCRQKAANVLATGGEFAILAHGQRRPADLDQWSYTRVWGGWR